MPLKPTGILYCVVLAFLSLPSLRSQTLPPAENLRVLDLSVGKGKIWSFTTNGIILRLMPSEDLTPRIPFSQLRDDDLKKLMSEPFVYSFLTEFTNDFDVRFDDPQWIALWEKLALSITDTKEGGTTGDTPLRKMLGTKAGAKKVDPSVLRQALEAAWQNAPTLQERVATRVQMLAALNTYQLARNALEKAELSTVSYSLATGNAIDRYNDAVDDYNQYRALRAEGFRSVEMASRTGGKYQSTKAQLAQLEAGEARQRSAEVKARADYFKSIELVESLFQLTLVKKAGADAYMIPRFLAKDDIDGIGLEPARVLSEVPKGPSWAPGSAEGAASPKAIMELNQRAMTGDVAAQYELGLCYLEGKGTAKDRQRAKDCFRVAAAKGHQEAKAVLDRLSQEE